MSPEDRRLLRLVGYGLLAFFFLWVAWRVREILPLFLLAVFIAYLFDPMLDRLQKRGWSRRMAVWFVYLLFFLLFIVAAVFVVPTTIRQIQNAIHSIPTYQEQLMDLVATAEDFLDRYEVPPQILEALDRGKEKLGELATYLAERVTRWIGGTISSLMLLLLLPILTFYFMNEFDPIRLKLLALVPAEYQDDVVQMSREVNEMLARYVRGQAIVSLLVATVTFAVLSIYSLIFGMKYALTLSVLAGFTCLIPYLGALVNAISVGAAAYLTSAHAPLTCVILSVLSMVVINQVFDNLITPRLVGAKVGMHPLLVLFALMAGGQIYGILGMLIAVPVAGTFKVLLLHLFPRLNTPLSELMKLDRRYAVARQERPAGRARRWRVALVPVSLWRNRKANASAPGSDEKNRQKAETGQGE